MGLLEDAIRAYATYEDRATDPDTPGSGQALVYVKDGKLHTVDDEGAVTEYGTGGGGGGGAVTEIGEVVLESAAADISFTAIPAGHKELRVVGRLRATRSAGTSQGRLRFGDGTLDTGNNYTFHFLRWTGADFSPTESTSADHIRFSETNLPAASAPANDFGAVEIAIPYYASSSEWRTLFTKVGRAEGGAHVTGSGTWKNTSDTVERLSIFPQDGNWAAGSKLTLYGIG